MLDLRIAAHEGHVEIVEALLERKFFLLYFHFYYFYCYYYYYYCGGSPGRKEKN